ncbi:SPFH domain-containing protein [Streptomyces sp. NPDC013157]|uniref:SPFH domain-containing protein n=1 Tax=Streptomyces sp. NPDC013157 TaxID=3364861 RepID=UPI0036CAF788
MRRRLLVGLAAAGVGGGTYTLYSVQVIPEGSAAVVERFGRYSRTLGSGLHTIHPYIDTIRNRIDLRRQTVPIPVFIETGSDDGTELHLNAMVHYQVTDPHTATYGIASYIQALDQVMRHDIVHGLRGLNGNFATAAVEELRVRIEQHLKEAAVDWGLTVYWFGLTFGDVPILSDRGAQQPRPEIVINATEVHMSRFGDTHITGNAQLGDHNSLDARSVHGLPPDQVLNLAAALVSLVRAEAASSANSDPALVTWAEAFEQEVQNAQTENRAPNTGRLRHAATQITAGLATTTALGGQIETLIGQLRHLLGL